MAKTSAKQKKTVKSRQFSQSPLQGRGEYETSGNAHANSHHSVTVLILAATVATIGLATMFIVREDPDSGLHITDADAQELSTQKATLSSQKQADKRVGESDRLGARNMFNQELQAPGPNHMREFQETILKQLQPKDITVSGRPVRVRELTGNKRRPGAASIRVYLFENFLSDYECDGLMSAHHRHVSEYSQDPIICFDSVDTLQRHLLNTKFHKVKVTSQDFTEGTTCVNSTFSKDLKSILGWSFSTAFYPGETKFTSVFDDRVYKATGLKPSNGGKYQITSYGKGIGYKTHTDCTIGNRDLRDRMGTILVYLQDVLEGGQTEFPELGISVVPRKGRAIVWNNQDANGRCDPFSLHAAQPVVKGQKIILQRWYYYRNFYMLGKRPEEPHLPLREEQQPVVSCDEYDHGSCRWYDEWSYDHLVQYRRLKKQLH